MKKIISKLALTLGLILMFGANAFAMLPPGPGNDNKYKTQDYTVECYNGTQKVTTMGNNTFGYSIKKAYKDDKQNLNTPGVSSGANSETLTLKNGAKKNDSDPTLPTLTDENINDYITPNKVDGFYPAEITVNGTTITITYTEIVPITYTISLAGLGASISAKQGVTLDGPNADGNYMLTVKGTIESETDLAKYITYSVDGYDAAVGFDGTNITITYTKQPAQTTKYTVQCTVNGETQTYPWASSYGYTVIKAYDSNNEAVAGISTENNAQELIITQWGAKPSLTTQTITDYIQAITGDDLGATITVNNTTITIAYQQIVTYTVTFENTPEGYGWDVKAGVTKIDDNHFKVAANITGQTWQNYITVVDLGGYQETVTINGTTITIGYAEAQEDEFTIGDLHYTVTKLAVKDGSAGTVSVRLVKDENGNVVAATDVTIPVSVTRGSFTYDVTEIEPFGFTKQYGKTEHSSTNNAQDRAIAADFLAGKINAISLRVGNPGDNDIAYHTNCSNPGSRTHERGADMDTKEDINNNNTLSTGNNARYSYYFLGYNSDLKTVTIPEGSKITKIGNNAFSGCWNLESFYVPFSVTSIGTGAFGGCISMSDFQFATGLVNGQPNMTQLTVIPDYMFIHCESLTTLRIPEGITTLGDRSTQYMLRLTKIELPSSLTTIEEEFLCTALSLKTLTIPANVGTIGASAFHGCEALEHIYFLGAPSALSMGTSSNQTFGPNDGYCALAIHGCAFHVLPQYLYNTEKVDGKSEWDEYHATLTKNAFNADKYDSTWGQVDGVNGNYFTSVFPDVEKKYTPGKWVTFCMPESEIFFKILDEDGNVTNPDFVKYNEDTQKAKTEGAGTDPEGQEGQEGVGVKARPAATTDASSGFLKYNFEYGWGDYNGFGPGCYVAEMIDVWQDPDTENHSQLYHANFRCIDIDNIQPNTPYLICPMLEEGATQENLNICLWTDNDLKRDAFVDNMGEEAKHLVTKHTSDTEQTNVGTTRPAFVYMIGQINRGEENPLLPGDIYFKSGDTTWTTDHKIGTFYMVGEGKTAYLHSCSAYWQIVQAAKDSGSYPSSQVKLGSVADFEDVPADPTAINEVQNDKPARIVVEGIYDMSGRKLDIDQSQLPEGLYIMNGKKVLNK